MPTIIILARTPEQRTFLMRLFILALVIRIVLATVIYAGHMEEFFGGDANTYDIYGQSLVEAWHGVADGDAPMDPDWQSAEIAVHTYDLASAIGYPTGDLDPEVAERGLVFMQANLTADNRAPAFEQEQPAPDGADAYQRLAAFAGRTVTPSR